MYNVPRFIPKVYLIHRDGRRWDFKDIIEAADLLWKYGYFGRYHDAPLFASHFKEARPHDYFADENNKIVFGSVIYHDYIVRDEIGEIITPDILKEARTKADPWWTRRDKLLKSYNKHFRSIPIPFTRCHRGGGRNYFRKIRTTAEIRENKFLRHDEDAFEYGIKARSRRLQNLPNAWDDIGRSDYKSHNWKKHRKHQWKEKK